MSLLAELQAAVDAEPWGAEVRVLDRAEFIAAVQGLLTPAKHVRHDKDGVVIASLETTPDEFWSEWWPAGDVAGIVSLDGGVATHAVVVDRVSPTRVYVRMRFGPPNPRSRFRKVWKDLGVTELEYVTNAVSKIKQSEKNKQCHLIETPHGPHYTHVIHKL